MHIVHEQNGVMQVTLLQRKHSEIKNIRKILAVLQQQLLSIGAILPLEEHRLENTKPYFDTAEVLS